MGACVCGCVRESACCVKASERGREQSRVACDTVLKEIKKLSFVLFLSCSTRQRPDKTEQPTFVTGLYLGKVNNGCYNE